MTNKAWPHGPLDHALRSLDSARTTLVATESMLKAARDAGRDDARRELVALLREDVSCNWGCLGEALSEGCDPSSHAHAAYCLGQIADALEAEGLELQQALERAREHLPSPADEIEGAYQAGRADQRAEQGETLPADALEERTRVLALISEDHRDFLAGGTESNRVVASYLRQLRYAVINGQRPKGGK